MFDQMQVTRMFQLGKLETVDAAVAKLLEFADYPHCYTTNMKQRSRPPDFSEERMPKPRLKVPTTVVAHS